MLKTLHRMIRFSSFFVLKIPSHFNLEMWCIQRTYIEKKLYFAWKVMWRQSNIHCPLYPIRNDSSENIKINNSSKEDLVEEPCVNWFTDSKMNPFVRPGEVHKTMKFIVNFRKLHLSPIVAVKLEFRILSRTMNRTNTKVLFLLAIFFRLRCSKRLDFSSIRSENGILKAFRFLIPHRIDPTVEWMHFLKLSRRFILLSQQQQQRKSSRTRRKLKHKNKLCVCFFCHITPNSINFF